MYNVEDSEETIKLQPLETYILKPESYDIHIQHPTNEIKRNISCSEALIFYLEEDVLVARPAVTEETAYHFWRSHLKHDQHLIFEDVRYLRIWLPSSATIVAKKKDGGWVKPRSLFAELNFSSSYPLGLRSGFFRRFFGNSVKRQRSCILL